MGCKMVDYKQVIVVREDLGMSKGKLAAQVAHASLNSAEKVRDRKPDWYDGWKGEKQKKVVVKAENRKVLEDLKREAEIQEIPSYLVKDAGLTEIPSNSKTALGVGPAPSEKVDRVTGHLKLLG